MNNSAENNAGFNVAKVKLKKPPRISNVWLIPFFSIVLGLWMVVNHYLNQGPTVSIKFDSAENLEEGATKIKILNIDIGEVTSIELNKTEDGIIDGVIVKALLDKSAERLLREDSQFWVVKPRIGSGGVSGLGTLLSGAYIELAPGKKGAYQTEFVGIEGLPSTPAGVDGLHFTLSSESDELLPEGTEIKYRGFKVGQIEKSELSEDSGRTIYSAFINAPYDELITENTHFWNISGIAVEASAKGFALRTNSIESVLSGGITFGVPVDLDPGLRVTEPRQFTLYPNENKTYQRHYQYGLELLLTMPNSIRGLDVDATVEYRGIRVGQVTHVNPGHASVPLAEGINVVIRLEPARLGLDDSEESVQRLKRELDKWVKRGFSATLKSGSIITGKKFINLDFFPPTKISRLGLGKSFSYLTMPTQAAGDIGQIQDRVSGILDKINTLPYQSIGRNTNQTLYEATKAMKQLTQISEQLGKITKSQSLHQIPNELNSTLKSLQDALVSFEPQQALMQETQNTLKAAQQTLSDMKPLLQTLNQQPNALLFNKHSQEDIQPKAQP